MNRARGNSSQWPATGFALSCIPCSVLVKSGAPLALDNVLSLEEVHIDLVFTIQQHRVGTVLHDWRRRRTEGDLESCWGWG